MNRRLQAIACTALLLVAVGGWAASYLAPFGVYRFIDWSHEIVMGNSLWTHEFTGIELTGGAMLAGTGWQSKGRPNRTPRFLHSTGWRFVRFGRPLVVTAPRPNVFGFGRTDWIVRIPFWFLTLLAAVAFQFGAVRPWRAARAAARVGLCRRCGYDLRASPERCPECGASAAAASTGAVS